MGIPRIEVHQGHVRLIVRGRGEVFGQTDSITVMAFETISPRTIEARLRALGWPRSESKCVASVLFRDIECMLRLKNVDNPITI